ncbi:MULTISPECIES: AraC family transcriptional regulator [unclassified Myroides]|uniref:AraC family transcriptional regulator n=1 Tax=unclassified Myroides TaxID=2642485 RepID=UPI003D2F8AF0
MELLKYILISIPVISSMTGGIILLLVFFKNLSHTEIPIFRTLGGYYSMLIALWFLDKLTHNQFDIRIHILPLMMLFVMLSQVFFYHFVCFFMPTKKTSHRFHYKQAFLMGIVAYVLFFILSKTNGVTTLDYQFLYAKSLGICIISSTVYYTFLFWRRMYNYQQKKWIVDGQPYNWIHLLLLGKTIFTILLFFYDRSVWIYCLLVLVLFFQHVVVAFRLLQEKNNMRIPQRYKNNIMLSSGQIICVDQGGELYPDVSKTTFFYPIENANNVLTQHDIVTYFTDCKPYTDRDFRLDTIVSHLGVNRTYVSKFINITYNCNVSQFINDWRLKEVAYLKQIEKENSIENLVIKAGFSDYRHYLRALKNAEKRQQF